MSIKLRPELNKILPDYHGAIDFAELAEYGIRPDEVIDFSVNSNPFGPAPSVLEAIRGANVARYPDKECLALRSALSGWMGIGVDQILVGNGSAELMWLVAFGFLSPGDDVLVIGPTFGEYGRNARLMGARVTEWQAKAENDFRLDDDAIIEIEALLGELRPKIVHICNPNNPTGQSVGLDVLKRWSETFQDSLFVIDEAYEQFLPVGVDGVGSKLALKRIGGSDPVHPYPIPDNMLILRSMTKDYSLAGIRLGYLVGPQHLVDGLRTCRVPWSVSEVAQAAGVAALAAQAEYEVMWARLRVEAVRFKQSLSELGYRVVPSPMHYFLMEVGASLTFQSEIGGASRQFRERLLKEGMLVRLCESYRLPRFVRVSTQRAEENDRLLSFFRDAKMRRV